METIQFTRKFRQTALWGVLLLGLHLLAVEATAQSRTAVGRRGVVANPSNTNNTNTGTNTGTGGTTDSPDDGIITAREARLEIKAMNDLIQAYLQTIRLATIAEPRAQDPSVIDLLLNRSNIAFQDVSLLQDLMNAFYGTSANTNLANSAAARLRRLGSRSGPRFDAAALVELQRLNAQLLARATSLANAAVHTELESFAAQLRTSLIEENARIAELQELRRQEALEARRNRFTSDETTPGFNPEISNTPGEDRPQFGDSRVRDQPTNERTVE